MSDVSTAAALWRGVRPNQWAKNLLVFGAAFFNLPELSSAMLLEEVLLFALFCASSSAVYLFNDIRDRDRDRLHPAKQHRPIAAGDLSVGLAQVLVVVFAGVGLAGAYVLNPDVAFILAFYIAQNIAYSLYLKNIVIIDAFMVSLGYLLRILAGAVLVEVEISFWVMLCTLLATLFVTFAKRRNELTLLAEGATNHRSALRKYDPYFLDQMIAVTTASTVVTYALWTQSTETVEKFGTEHLQYTIPFVFYGIFRYLYIVHREGKGGDPTKIFLTDPHLIVTVLLWAGSVAWILFE